jgi:DNA-binding Lrp family transcriptional regulator
LNLSTAAFILASFSYRNGETPLSQRVIAEQIAKFSEVQEVHIISGDWDILIKIKEENVDAVGNFVVDKLRTVKGIEKTLTCMVFDTQKETTELTLPLSKRFLKKIQ